MLNIIRARLAYHLQAILNCFNVLVNNPVAASMTVLVLGVTLMLPMIFLVLTNNIQQATVDWQSGGHIALYLTPGLPAADETSLLTRVRATQGVQDALLKPADEALIELQGQDGMKDIMHYLPSNPLPAVIDVIPMQNMKIAEKLASVIVSPDTTEPRPSGSGIPLANARGSDLPGETMTEPEKLNELYKQLQAYPHVEQAKFDLQWVSRLYTWLAVVGQVALGLVVVLSCAVILIIGNTLRMAMHHRQEEIQVLTLIGANAAYIRRPFLYLGLFYGITGSTVGILIVWVITKYVSLLIAPIATTYDMHYDLVGLSIQQGLLLVLTAAMLGWLGARLSVHSLCKRQA